MNTVEHAQISHNTVDLGSLLVQTGATIASLVLFPAITQSLKISPTLVNAVKIALRNKGK